MLYHVTMDVHPPTHLTSAAFDDLKAEERAMSHRLQQSGEWRHLWRVAGRYANVSIFDVPSHDALHTILSGLPLFPYMTIAVTALAQHPSALAQNA